MHRTGAVFRHVPLPTRYDCVELVLLPVADPWGACAEGWTSKQYVIIKCGSPRDSLSRALNQYCSKVTHAPVLVSGSPTIGDLVSLPLSANVPPRELSRPPTRTGAQSNAFFEVNTGKLSPCCHSSVADPFHLNRSSKGKLLLTKSLPLHIERRSDFLFLKFCFSLKYGFVKLSLTYADHL